jgi:anaphase-promoting complex subunit 4
LKFSDNKQLLVLLETNSIMTNLSDVNRDLLLLGWTALLTIPYEKPDDTDTSLNRQYMQYSPVAKANQSSKLLILTNDEVIERFPQHKVATDGFFVPGSFEVRQQNPTSKKPSKQRIVVLERDRLHYNVLQFADPVSGDEINTDGDVSMF